jgi:HAD superfamily phosphoserine phosphatase-like hydrolase
MKQHEIDNPEVFRFTEALEPFLFKDAAIVGNKLANFEAEGAESWHVLLDFDRTLTCANESGKDFYTWTILESYLPEEFRKPSAELYQQYRPIELRGEMTEAIANEWWNKSLQMMKEAGVNLREVEHEFMSRASIRPGVKEIFGLCKGWGIPIAILSAGITDVIEIWCRHFNIEPNYILSTKLQLTSDGRIAGWDRNKLIHPFNKREQGHSELVKLTAGRPRAIIVGDSLDDAKMAAGSDSVLRVRIYDPRPDEHDSASAQAATLENFDLMLAHGSLKPLVSLMDALLRRR